MKFDFSTPTPLQYFTTLVRSDEHLPLLEAAASLAQDEYPELDVQQVLSDVDHLAARLARRVAEGAGAVDRLRALNQLFFADLGFGGNVNDYYNPDNSYLHRVLHTRRGIPISLAVLWLELAQGVGLRAHGVAFPGHFLVKVLMPTGQVVMDPMTGLSLSREALGERLEPFRRGHGPLEDEAPLGLYLQAATERDILARMLRNLKEIHRARQDWSRLVAVQDRLIVLLPDAWSEWRDRGLAYAESGASLQALENLETYLAHAAGAEDAPAIAQRVKELRRF